VPTAVFFSIAMAQLLTPWRMGGHLLPNRIVLAPLTRKRATHPERIPTELMAEHYAARADAGLLIAEATDIMDNNHGSLSTPGIYTPAQVAGWALVTRAVHARAGRIFLQLWHQGRAGKPELSGGPEGVISASAIDGWIDGAGKPARAPREATIGDIERVIAAYTAGAKNAATAGFDGIEVHAANGYLLHQFICSGSNARTDDYGGSPANRARLLREVVAACVDVLGAERVGVRISPGSGWQGMRDADPVATWTQVVRDLAAAGPLAYLHIVEPRDSGYIYGPPPDAASATLTHAWARSSGFTQPTISAGGYTDIAGAATAISAGADAIAFGRLYISNPDLVARVRRVAAGLPTPLNAWDRATFYAGGADGYTRGYPLLSDTEPEEGVAEREGAPAT
jgi:N-ethylmaleimide reductase